MPIPCFACDYCAENDSCKSDDLNDFYEKLEDADVIIIATPVYFLSFPAPLKALFDRLQIYYNKQFKKNIRPAISKPKKGILICSSGSSKSDSIEIIEKQVKMAFTILNTSLFEKIIIKNTDENLSKEYIEEEILIILKNIKDGKK
jgi:multimeric flavodoxin WrbA